MTHFKNQIVITLYSARFWRECSKPGPVWTIFSWDIAIFESMFAYIQEVFGLWYSISSIKKVTVTLRVIKYYDTVQFFPCLVCFFQISIAIAFTFFDFWILDSYFGQKWVNKYFPSQNRNTCIFSNFIRKGGKIF